MGFHCEIPLFFLKIYLLLYMLFPRNPSWNLLNTLFHASDCQPGYTLQSSGVKTKPVGLIPTPKFQEIHLICLGLKKKSVLESQSHPKIELQYDAPIVELSFKIILKQDLWEPNRWFCLIQTHQDQWNRIHLWRTRKIFLQICSLWSILWSILYFKKGKELITFSSS